MFTNQWNAYLRAKLIGEISASFPGGLVREFGGTSITSIVACGQNSYTPTQLDINSSSSSWNATDQGIKFGTGTTTPIVSDYNLESPLDSLSITCTGYTGAASSRTDDSGNTTITYTNTIRNLTSAPISISEVGLYDSIYTSASSNARKLILLWRDVLSTPVVLAANETKTIETIITFPAPTA